MSSEEKHTGEITFWEKLWLWCKGELPQYHRLIREMDVFEHEMKCLPHTGEGKTPAAGLDQCQVSANCLLGMARKKAKKDPGYGWRCLNGAKRMLLVVQTDTLLKARAWALLHEVAEKKDVSEWRRNSIVATLAQEENPLKPKSDVTNWEIEH